MSDLQEGAASDEKSPVGLELEASDGPAATPATDRRNPRIYLRKELAERLVRLGVPDDCSSLGRTVNELADMTVSLGYAYLPDITDLVSLEVGIHDRLEELTAVTTSLLQLLVEIGATGEYRTLLHSFKQLAKENAPKSQL